MPYSLRYYLDEIKDRGYYILGIIILLLSTSLTDLFILGPIFKDAEAIGLLPNDIGIARILRWAAVFAIFAASWDLLSGYSGQISFGHALFLGLGAYLSIIVKRKYVDATNIVTINGITMDLNILFIILFVSLIVALFALILGIFTLRLKGAYFALVTLVLPLIAQILALTVYDDITGGEGGLSLAENEKLVQIKELGLESFQKRIIQEYHVILVIMLLSVSTMYLLARSRYGLVLRAIREDEQAALASGINVNLYKVSVFAISAFFASIAGGLLTQINGSATASYFEAENSFTVIIFTILGGIGSIAGGVVGSFVMLFSIEIYIGKAFLDVPTLKTLTFGLILILTLRFQPLGLIRADPKFRNSMIFASLWTFIVIFYDYGKILASMPKSYTPQKFLIDHFGDNGLLGINVIAIEGRILIYFIIGVLIGYYFPDLFSKIRLKIWGVWPNLGKFDPPK